MPENDPQVGDIWVPRSTDQTPMDCSLVLKCDRNRVFLLGQMGRTVCLSIQSFLLSWRYTANGKKPSNCIVCGDDNGLLSHPAYVYAMLDNGNEAYGFCLDHYPLNQPLLIADRNVTKLKNLTQEFHPLCPSCHSERGSKPRYHGLGPATLPVYSCHCRAQWIWVDPTCYGVRNEAHNLCVEHIRQAVAVLGGTLPEVKVVTYTSISFDLVKHAEARGFVKGVEVSAELNLKGASPLICVMIKPSVDLDRDQETKNKLHVQYVSAVKEVGSVWEVVGTAEPHSLFPYEAVVRRVGSKFLEIASVNTRYAFWEKSSQEPEESIEEPSVDLSQEILVGSLWIPRVSFKHLPSPVRVFDVIVQEEIIRFSTPDGGVLRMKKKDFLLVFEGLGLPEEVCTKVRYSLAPESNPLLQTRSIVCCYPARSLKASKVFKYEDLRSLLLPRAAVQVLFDEYELI